MTNKHIVHSYDQNLEELKNLVLEMIDKNILLLTNLYDIATSDIHHTPENVVESFNSSELKCIENLDRQIIKKSLRIMSLRNPLAQDLRFVFACSHISRNLERVGMNSNNIMKHMHNLKDSTNIIEVKISQMMHALIEMMRDTKDALQNLDADIATKTIEKDERVNGLYIDISHLAINQTQDVTSILSYIQSYIMLSRYLERIGDHIVNVCKKIQFVVTADFDLDATTEEVYPEAGSTNK